MPCHYLLSAISDRFHFRSSGDRPDVIGRLDPTTGKTVIYPFPHMENTMREFYYDSQGRMGWASPANNKVGYFYLTENTERASRQKGPSPRLHAAKAPFSSVVFLRRGALQSAIERRTPATVFVDRRCAGK